METTSKKQKVKLAHLFHKEAKQISLEFFYNPELIELIKEIPGMKWSKENKCWYILNNKENLKTIFNTFKGLVWFDTSDFFRKKHKKENNENQLTLPLKNEPCLLEIIDQYILELEAKSFSKSTINAHKKTITNFVDFLATRETSIIEIA
jgi:integrase/recombinase XerD